MIVLLITLATIPCCCDGWEEIESYGQKKELWVRKDLELAKSFPSHDTFNRNISAIDLKYCNRVLSVGRKVKATLRLDRYRWLIKRL